MLINGVKDCLFVGFPTFKCPVERFYVVGMLWIMSPVPCVWCNNTVYILYFPTFVLWTGDVWVQIRELFSLRIVL